MLLWSGDALLGQFEPSGVADYRMDVRLDSASKTIRGKQTITWRNRTAHPAHNLYLHLYLNAFRDRHSSFVRETGYRPLWQVDGEIPQDYWGYVEIERMTLGEEGTERTEAIVGREFVQPDDSNSADRTVMRVDLSRPVPPGGELELLVEFTSKLPRGVARTGWVEDYYFAAQWYPKLGVFRDGKWNCHQYHSNTEYFADFGRYDVRLTVPADLTVGGTGSFERLDNGDGTATYRFQQDRVHDFAWVAGSRFLVREETFHHPGLPSVALRLLLQPENRHLDNRYLEAVKHTLRLMGEWFGPYPYPTLTIVDPAFGSDTGGMEYPTFITGGVGAFAPPASLNPESVTAHEVGHQWWYAVVGSNEFEEAWLDEGINSWAESRVLRESYPPRRYTRDFFGGFPVVFPSVEIPFETFSLADVRRGGSLEEMARPSWKLFSSRAYQVNSYAKPELAFWTLERLLGWETMQEIFSLYYQRFAFRHATTEDFIAVAEEVARRDLSWFFEPVFYGSEPVDYAVISAKSVEIPEGSESEDGFDETRKFLSQVIVERLGGAALPVEVLLVFEDGEEIRRAWNGADGQRRFQFEGEHRLRYAVVDPERKILLDVDPTNNSLREETQQESGPSRAALKWSSKWLFWLQNLLETMTLLG